MRTVWKYKLPHQEDSKITLELPRNAKVLMCDAQGDGDYIWCEINTDVSVEKRIFFVLGTGHPLPTDCSYDYVASWTNGPFVWHLYEFTS